MMGIIVQLCSHITTCITCGADAGTVSVNMSNTTANNYVLCYGDSIELNSNGNYVLPPAADVSGLGYAIYAVLQQLVIQTQTRVLQVGIGMLIHFKMPIMQERIYMILF